MASAQWKKGACYTTSYNGAGQSCNIEDKICIRCFGLLLDASADNLKDTAEDVAADDEAASTEDAVEEEASDEAVEPDVAAEDAVEKKSTDE